MKITIEKTIGKKKYTFQIDENDFFVAYREAAKVDMLPTQCSVCGGEDLSLIYREPKGFKYPGVKCNKFDCLATTSIQGKKDGSEDFVKPMEKFVPKEQAPQQQDNSGYQSQPNQPVAQPAQQNTPF